MVGGTFVQMLALVLAGLSGSVLVLGMLAFMAGFGQSTVLISYLTIRTASSPDAMLGRIGATARVFSLGLQPIGLVATGAMIDLTDGSSTLIAVGALVGAIGVLGYRSKGLRRASFASLPAVSPATSGDVPSG